MRYSWIALLPFVVAIIVVSCQQPSIKTERSNNPCVPVELLFEYDGVKVYRFYDGHIPHYYTSRGEAMGQVGIGKNKYEENIR